MISLIVFLSFILGTLAIGVMAGLSDWRGLTIPNIYSVLIAAGFFLCYGSLWLLGDTSIFAALWKHLAAGALVFVITALLFTFRMLGAADSKLASAYAFWTGLHGIPVFIFMMTVIGAFIAIFALYIKKKKPFKSPQEGSWIAQVQGGASKVPYGIAIAGGAAYGYFMIGYFDFVSLAEIFLKT